MRLSQFMGESSGNAAAFCGGAILSGHAGPHSPILGQTAAQAPSPQRRARLTLAWHRRPRGDCARRPRERVRGPEPASAHAARVDWWAALGLLVCLDWFAGHTLPASVELVGGAAPAGRYGRTTWKERLRSEMRGSLSRDGAASFNRPRGGTSESRARFSAAQATPGRE